MTTLQIALTVAGVATYGTGALLAAEWTRRDNADTHMFTPDKHKPSVFWSAVTWPMWASGAFILLGVAAVLILWERAAKPKPHRHFARPRKSY